MIRQAGPYPYPSGTQLSCCGCAPGGGPQIPSLGLYLLYTVGHLLGQVLQELLSDDVGTDLLRHLAGEDFAVELPGPWPRLCQEVLLWAQREYVNPSVPTRASYSLSLPGGTLRLVFTRQKPKPDL